VSLSDDLSLHFLDLKQPKRNQAHQEELQASATFCPQNNHLYEDPRALEFVRGPGDGEHEETESNPSAVSSNKDDVNFITTNHIRRLSFHNQSTTDGQPIHHHINPGSTGQGPFNRTPLQPLETPNQPFKSIMRSHRSVCGLAPLNKISEGSQSDDDTNCNMLGLPKEETGNRLSEHEEVLENHVSSDEAPNFTPQPTASSDTVFGAIAQSVSHNLSKATTTEESQSPIEVYEPSPMSTTHQGNGAPDPEQALLPMGAEQEAGEEPLFNKNNTTLTDDRPPTIGNDDFEQCTTSSDEVFETPCHQPIVDDSRRAQLMRFHLEQAELFKYTVGHCKTCNCLSKPTRRQSALICDNANGGGLRLFEKTAEKKNSTPDMDGSGWIWSAKKPSVDDRSSEKRRTVLVDQPVGISENNSMRQSNDLIDLVQE
jgi:hypothetical protein